MFLGGIRNGNELSKRLSKCLFNRFESRELPKVGRDPFQKSHRRHLPLLTISFDFPPYLCDTVFKRSQTFVSFFDSIHLP